MLITLGDSWTFFKVRKEWNPQSVGIYCQEVDCHGLFEMPECARSLLIVGAPDPVERSGFIETYW